MEFDIKKPPKTSVLRNFFYDRHPTTGVSVAIHQLYSALQAITDTSAEITWLNLKWRSFRESAQ